MGLLHFLDLPLELLLSILKRIDTLHDKLSVVFTCHKLYSALYYDVVSEQIRRGAGKDVYGLREDLLVRKPGTANSEPIRLERFRPFVFSGSSVSEDGASLMVKLIVPRFMPPDDDFHEGDIIIEKNTVYVYRNVKGSKSTDVDNILSDVFEVQWNAHLRCNIAKMTAKLLRRHWNCPECYGRRYICHCGRMARDRHYGSIECTPVELENEVTYVR
ncbi:hypothetical protein PM082_015390 [Marasmius tenuissimus]|nr:hypothetical protein PM082_015390 [Marasmius tenuissimus]